MILTKWIITLLGKRTHCWCLIGWFIEPQ